MSVNKGIVIVIYSHATGNFSRIRRITKFLDRYKLYAAIDNSELDDTRPPIVIEINLIESNQRWIVPQLKRFVEETGLSEFVRFTVKDQDLPSFSEMASNLGKSLFATGMNAIKTGFKQNSIIATAEEKQRRLDICNGCDHYDHRLKRCNRCGCNLIYKASLSTAKCPIRKW